MYNIILFDDHSFAHLLPLTFTRPIGELRMGILTIKEKWQKLFEGDYSYLTQAYLSEKYLIRLAGQNLLINGAVLPTQALCSEIRSLEYGEVLMQNDVPIAMYVDDDDVQLIAKNEMPSHLQIRHTKQSFIRIHRPYDIFRYNHLAIEADFELLTRGRTSQPISATNKVLGAEKIFLEEGAMVECSILNATTGSIYIGKEAEIMEGSVVRGALALCEHAALKLSTKIYGATTVGPYSKVGGEVNTSVIFGYSNKGHDGFLGNSVLGEWCNLGADTNNSNLKNNYGEVKLWDYALEDSSLTGLQFCGLIMGDHSKSGINTMFNTGTVVGVSCNIYGGGFPPTFIPSFSWGGSGGFEVYRFEKACEVAERMMERRTIHLSATDRKILEEIYHQEVSSE
jgi:UDP-N-acetylglucosamine diphosphorylase/glucosamine-1-phosphate N-acetyltransferase